MMCHPFLQRDCGATALTLAGAYLRNPEQFVAGGDGGRHRAPREAVASAMRSRYAAYGLVPPATLDRLAEGAPTWAGGHQLVAAGGPAFFHYKILSMVRRSRLRADSPIPVFWLASEDHDWDEVRKFPTAFGRGGGHEWAAGACQGAVGRWRFDEAAHAVAANWMDAANLPESWADQIRTALRGSKTLAEATFRLVHEWFGEDGVLVLDADDPQLKALAAPLWEAELAGRGIGEAVRTRTEALAAAGWNPGLHPREIALFELRDGERIRLEVTDRGVAPVDGAWTIHPQEAASGSRSERWSPNAALRPLYQEWLLGNHAVFLGPSELAYWLQLTSAFQQTGLRFPRLELRDGAVAVSPDQWAWLEGAGWHPSEGTAGIEARWRQTCADGAHSALPSWDFESWAEEFAARVKPLDATLEGAARAAVKKMEKAYDAVAGKVRRAWRQQHADEEQFSEQLMERLAPGQIPQERAEHIAPIAEAVGGWAAYKAAWCAVHVDEPVFSVWVVDLPGQAH